MITTTYQFGDATDVAASGFRSVAARVAEFREAIVRRHRQRRAIRQLRLLNDSLLKDIGIHRSEITSVVRGMDVDTTRRRNVRFF